MKHWHDLKWEPITAERFDELLGAVPPERYFPGGFVVGEPMSDIDGVFTWIICRQCGGQHFQTEGTLGAVEESFPSAA